MIEQVRKKLCEEKYDNLIEEIRMEDSFDDRSIIVMKIRDMTEGRGL